MNRKEGLLLDFSSIREGGGCQLALNFLEGISSTEFREHQLFITVPDTGPLSQFNFEGYEVEFIRVPQKPVMRAYFEYWVIQSMIRKYKINYIFTFFGPGLPHPKNVRSIVGVAYPIICYDDSPFWKKINAKYKRRIKIKNYLRCKRLKKADLIIAETTVMASRLSTKLNYSMNQIYVIPPAVTKYVDSISVCDSETVTRSFLFLSGNSPHKNLSSLYNIAMALVEKGQNDFSFILSINKDDWITSLDNNIAIDFSFLDRHFKFVGNVDPKEIGKLYSQCDALINLSDLESFSNNYMEAWKVGVPLIVSDRDFAKNICRRSALYCEPHDPNDVANKIVTLINDRILRQLLIAEGQKELQKLPSIDQRIHFLYYAILKNIDKYALLHK